MVKFPARVWERSLTGNWVSRPANDLDQRRRSLLWELLQSDTPKERRQQLAEELASGTW